jgi:hypothetical protein
MILKGAKKEILPHGFEDIRGIFFWFQELLFRKGLLG